ncbi:MAG: hypothetical protein FJW36_09685 [Acidobacteria bacterium]|nr:hypothetical protein [Acidobacteriota bacterium]
MKKRRIYILLAFFALLSGAAWWFFNSGAIESYIITRAQAEVEKALGAKLTIGQIRLNLLKGQAIVNDVTIRGTEPAAGQPFLHTQSATLDFSLSTLSSSRVDLRALSIAAPKIYVITYPNGTTNLPGPKVKTRGRTILENLVNLHLGKLNITNGEFRWNEQRTPFDFNSTGVLAKLDYLPPSRTYKGSLQTANASYTHDKLPPIAGSLDTAFSINSENILIEQATFKSGKSTIVNARGTLHHLDNRETPFRLDFDVDSTIEAALVLPFLKLPLDPTGLVAYNGKLLYEAGRGFELHGDAKARDLFYRDPSSRLGPLRATSRVDFLPARLTLSKIKAEGFGGTLDGIFLWDAQEGWRLDGDLANVKTSDVLSQLGSQQVPWSGEIHGPIEAQGGKKPLVLMAELEIDASQGPAPLSGLLAVTYEEAGNHLLARNSYLALPHSRINFAGDLLRGITFEFNSTRLRELLPVLQLAGYKGDQMPVNLDRGSTEIKGQLTGSLKAPRLRADLSANNLLVSNQPIDSLQTKLTYGDELLTVYDLSASGLGATATGRLRAVLEDGQLTGSSILSGNIQSRVSDLSRLPLPEPLKGSADLSLTIRGNWNEPAAEAILISPAIDARGYRFQQINALFTATQREVKVSSFDALLNRQPLKGLINIKATSNDWSRAAGNIILRATAIPLTTFNEYRQQDIAVDAQLTSDAQVDFSWSPDGLALSKIDGRLTLANITRYGRPIGQLEFTSRTTGNRAALTALGQIRQLPVRGDATIRLGTRLDTELRLQLPRLDFPTIAQLFSETILPSPLPYEGGAEASFFIKGPLLDPNGWDGRLTIPQLQLAPNKDYVRESMPAVADVVLRNEVPIVFELRRDLIAARDIRLTAKNTNLNASLAYRTSNGGITGSAKGNINLAILSTLKPDLLTTGVASLDANIQGFAKDPQLNGRLAFQNASFYLRDVITGLDKVNGTVLFDKNRATIESLQAQAGGGQLQLTGFVGFGKLISYRLQAQATQVRLRYPEGISTSANATLALTGTTAQSILTGTVSILRSTIGQIDTSQLIAANTATTESPTTTQNEFLKNLQFDVRVEAAQNVEISTAFTKDVQGEIGLRLRGTPQRPIVLGRIAITQGEVDFFGSRYSISRGEVTFSNPLKIEPLIGLDLETRVRGVVIAINFSGPASKLNMTYRSDPPLQSQEILALLTVGRNPNTTGSLSQGPVGQTQGMFGNDSSVVLGAAVTAGINGRLQRFFGISRVRIDPQLTGIDNVPQARLTLEQQVSRDVTLTYITNLNRTQQQIVRLDWDISRAWSVVAVRDENGIFGLDLFFRKRVK